MKMNWKRAALAGAAMVSAIAATPASAAIYTYTQSNGTVLRIDSTLGSATMIGSNINVSMTSPDFKNFTGGAKPSFTAILTTLDGTWNGLADNPSHQQKLIMSSTNVNLWSWWGNPIQGGDYVTSYGTYTPPPPSSTSTSTGGTSTSTGGPTPVPEPGMVGLFALGAAGLALSARRRRRKSAE